MFFSRIQLMPDITPRQVILTGSIYQQHKAIWKLFADSPDRKRDFLFRQEQSAEGSPIFYTLSERAPQDHSEIWKVETKGFRPEFRQGDLLQFDLRSNPTVDRNKDECRSRHDVVMDLKHKLAWRDLPVEKRPTTLELIQQAGSEWLIRRAANCGFEIIPEELLVGEYAKRKFMKRGNQVITVSTLDFRGILHVIDPARFWECMRSGIGRGKGFGCGLLMVKRV